MGISADVTVPGVATVTLTGLTPATRTFYQYPMGDGSDPLGTGFSGWTAGASTSIVENTEYLQVDVTGTGYVTRTMGTAAATTRLLRALVRLDDPEAIPVLVYGTDQTGSQDLQNPGRYVGADPVWVDVMLDGATATSARFYVVKAAGVTSSRVKFLGFEFWRVGAASDWYLSRTDHNGTDVALADWRTSQLYPDAGGSVVFVDREAAIGDPVTWKLWTATPGTTQTTTATLTDDDGYAMLHRPLDAASPLLPVALVTMTSRRASRSTVLDAQSDPYPSIAVRPMSARAGTFTLYTATLDDAEAIADELATGELVMLRQPHADQRRLDVYFVAESVDVAQTSDDGVPPWSVSGSYNETRRGVA